MPATTDRIHVGARDLRRWAPGVGACAAIAAVAVPVGGLVPVVGAPVIAILAGIALSGRAPAAWRPGVAVTSRRVLQASVVLLGTGLSLGQVATTGVRSLPVLVGSVAAALLVAWVLGRRLRLGTDLATLVGVGSAICGASAIAAADSVIGADESDVSYAVSTIFVFNVVAVVAYPPLGHLLGLSQATFGTWAGTAVNDVSSVVATAGVYGHAALARAVVVKLTRTLAIVPICVWLGWRRAPRAGGRRPVGVPGFIIGFVLAAAADSLGLVPAGCHRGLADLSGWMITAALAAVGLSTDTRRMRRAGARPLALGAALWATVGVVGLALQPASTWLG